VLDIRAPARVATGRIEIVSDERFHNIVGSKLITFRKAAEIGLAMDEPVAVVCAQGNDSRVVAGFLNQLGYDAKSIQGGMERWMRTLVPAHHLRSTGWSNSIGPVKAPSGICW
jgi:rhodanese-related sulfurtransferase